jgi:hypothetical protein
VGRGEGLVNGKGACGHEVLVESCRSRGGEKLHSQLENILEFTFNLDIVDVIEKVVGTEQQ